MPVIYQEHRSITFLRELSSAQWYSFSFACTALLAGIWWWCLYHPLSEKIWCYERAQEELAQKITVLEKKLSLQKNNDQQAKLLLPLEEKMVQSTSNHETTQRILALIKHNNLTLSHYKIAHTQKHDRYQTYRCELDCNGSFRDFHIFCTQLKKMFHFCTVKTVSLTLNEHSNSMISIHTLFKLLVKKI